MKNLIRAVFDIGKRLQTALEADDLEAFYTLVDERDALILQLENPSTVSGGRMDVDDKLALEAQHKQIIAQLDQKERDMMDALQHLDKLKKAGQSYRSLKKRPQFIQSGLRG